MMMNLLMLTPTTLPRLPPLRLCMQLQPLLVVLVHSVLPRHPAAAARQKPRIKRRRNQTLFTRPTAQLIKRGPHPTVPTANDLLLTELHQIQLNHNNQLLWLSNTCTHKSQTTRTALPTPPTPQLPRLQLLQRPPPLRSTHKTVIQAPQSKPITPTYNLHNLLPNLVTLMPILTPIPSTLICLCLSLCLSRARLHSRQALCTSPITLT